MLVRIDIMFNLIFGGGCLETIECQHTSYVEPHSSAKTLLKLSLLPDIIDGVLPKVDVGYEWHRSEDI